MKATYVVEPIYFGSAEPQIPFAAPAPTKLYVTDEIIRVDGTHLGYLIDLIISLVCGFCNLYAKPY
jgi:hypothetical protein